MFVYIILCVYICVHRYRKEDKLPDTLRHKLQQLPYILDKLIINQAHS